MAEISYTDKIYTIDGKRQNPRTYKLSPKARKLLSSISTEGSSFMIESGNKDIYIVCGATDMRKGVDGLAAIVNFRLACDFSGTSMFIFCNKSRNRVKIIEWDGDGFWLYRKSCASQKGFEYCDRDSSLLNVTMQN